MIDPRDYEEGEDTLRWRNWLRRRLYELRGTRSDLSGEVIFDGFDVHEGLFPRRYVPKGVEWSWMIFSSVNCFMLIREEHYPQPPSREVCYWLAVATHGKEEVDAWVDSLPFKVPPDKPWRSTSGVDIINHIRRTRRLDSMWEKRMSHPKVLAELSK